VRAPLVFEFFFLFPRVRARGRRRYRVPCPILFPPPPFYLFFTIWMRKCSPMFLSSLRFFLQFTDLSLESGTGVFFQKEVCSYDLRASFETGKKRSAGLPFCPLTDLPFRSLLARGLEGGFGSGRG